MQASASKLTLRSPDRGVRPNGQRKSQRFHGKPREDKPPASPRRGKQHNRRKDKKPACEEQQKARDLHSRGLRFIDIGIASMFVAACRVCQTLRFWLSHTIRKGQTTAGRSRETRSGATRHSGCLKSKPTARVGRTRNLFPLHFFIHRIGILVCRNSGHTNLKFGPSKGSILHLPYKILMSRSSVFI